MWRLIFVNLYSSGLNFEFFQMKKVSAFIRESGTKSSDMRFATEQAYSRSVVKAELTFSPTFSNEGLIFTLTEKLKIQIIEV